MQQKKHSEFIVFFLRRYSKNLRKIRWKKIQCKKNGLQNSKNAIFVIQFNLYVVAS